MKIEIPKGFSIGAAVQYTIAEAIRTRHNYVTFIFNDVELSVSPGSCDTDICTIYHLECKVHQLENKLRSY